jgi:hypothetical protein
MTRGKPTDLETELKFRELYLKSGNISECARQVGLPVTTAHAMAGRAHADPEFVQKRKDMYARVVPDVEGMLREALEAVQARILEPDLTAKELAGLVKSLGLKSFSYQNPKPQYLRGLVDGLKTLNAARKDKADEGKPTTVVVKVSPTQEAAERIDEKEPDDGNDASED